MAYSFAYDANGRMTGVMDSDGKFMSYEYNNLGNRVKMTGPDGKEIAYKYDSGNRLSELLSEAGAFTFTYDSLGRRTKLILPNGTYTTYSYDNDGRLTNLKHKTLSSSTIASFTYTHDNIGNRITKTLDTGTKYTYSYDAIYRLTEALSSTPGYSSNTKGKGSGISNVTQNQKEFYSYDPVGNRLTSDHSRTYFYNAGNQLMSSNDMQYEYDLNGNLITKVSTEGITTYSYDYENRLVKVVKPDGMIVEFKYDPFGRRIEKKVMELGVATTTRYLYDNEDIIFEYDENGTIGNRYIHGLGIDEPLALINDKGMYYYHADGLGSIVALTDSTQKVVQDYQYDSFGNLKDQKNRIKQPYAFTAREWDKETGLYYYRARFYDAKVGRFTTVDPVLHNSVSNCSFKKTLFNPQRLNPFIYADDNPINFVDPKGLACGPGTIGDIVIPDSYFLWYTFQPVCKEHDECYGCKGKKLGKTKEQCDNEFRDYLNIICDMLPENSFKRIHCEGAAKRYYEAVRDHGDKAFREAREECCK